MELIRIFVQAFCEWFRETTINVAGRLIEEIVGVKVKRRAKRRQRRPRKRG